MPRVAVGQRVRLSIREGEWLCVDAPEFYAGEWHYPLQRGGESYRAADPLVTEVLPPREWDLGDPVQLYGRTGEVVAKEPAAGGRFVYTVRIVMDRTTGFRLTRTHVVPGHLITSG
jgi:hypothetical protein